MPNQSFIKLFNTFNWVHVFHKGICPNVYAIVWLKLEPAYYDVEAQLISLTPWIFHKKISRMVMIERRDNVSIFQPLPSNNYNVWLQYDIIIIIMSCYQHRHPWPSLTTIPIVHCFWFVIRAISRIGAELLYVGSKWSSCLCSSMWRGPQEYFVPTSSAMSCMSGSSNFVSFLWWVVGGRTAIALLDAASRTFSIFPSAFLCSCHQAFSRYV